VCEQSSDHPHHSLPTHWGPPVAKQTASSEWFVANARASAAAPSSPIEFPPNPRTLSVRLAMSASANIAAPAAPIPLLSILICSQRREAWARSGSERGQR